ncbi:hypothetical protein B0T19DRAFT_444525 [Cercophora scortea]|uniref:Uncharacterized protein n=1 Tax=Cercophora scortea TaxID=314031 RepID=A0AAE0M638_9PEZI|nr:hypothetical protein B0T19DRAFT_444525 [Cercophora scortea]
MARRVYTIAELLKLRNGKIHNRLLALSCNPEFAEIIRDSGSESSDAQAVLVKHKDDSSVSSDELLFKGNISRRQIREPARELVREPVREPVREAMREPIREPVRVQAREATLEPPRQMDWKYRGRSDSEVAANEPLPAPSGVPAQRSEGFQRFYKAVVSPTHVRVTAGGRIVPNTRAPSSPTSKRSKDRSTIDSQGVADKVNHGKPALGPYGPSHPLPVMSPFIPAYPTGFQPIQTTLPFMPMPFGAHLPPGFSFPQPAVSPSAMAQLPTDGTLKDTHNKKPEEVRGEKDVLSDKQEKVKITPPEFFDVTKPFFFNGQYMYPFPAAFPAAMGNPVVPFHMVGLPPGAAQQMTGHVMQPAPNGTGHPMNVASYPAPSGHGSPGVPIIVNRPTNSNFQPPSAPPISSIKLSDITRKQIESFKSSLKYHEDQLQYNRHQIDEKEMEAQIQTIQGHIQRFETMLKNQVEYEESVLRKADPSKDDKNDSQPPASAAGEARVSPQPEFQGNPEIREAQHTANSAGTQRRAFIRSGPDFSSNNAESGGSLFEFAAEAGRPTFGDMKKSALPSEAALAPVFLPRGHASSWGGSEHSREAQEETERRLLAAAGRKTPYATVENQQPVSQPFSQPSKTNSSETSNYFDAPASSYRSRADHSYGVPYLLGALPKGVNPRTARDQDYEYTRPLTEEERRARFLYWGKAPKSVVQGLPKFDGKHFYPPSPIKENISDPPQDPIRRRVPTGRAEMDYEFRLTKSDCDPFRPITPVQNFDLKTDMGVEDASAIRHIRSYDTQVFSASEDLPNSAGDMDFREPGTVLESCENSVDATSIGSHERRSERSGTKFWQAKLKKGSTSSAVSSTTAQGYLPHYSGYAAASLSPSINKNQVSPIRETSPGKLSSDFNDLSDGGVLLTPGLAKHGENRPPATAGSLEDQFKNIALDVSDRRDLMPAFQI